jgi:hypothetical protein
LSIVNLALIIVFLASLACMGLASPMPQVVIPALFVFFAIVFWLIYVVVRRQQTHGHSETETPAARGFRKIVGVIVWVVVLGCLALMGLSSDHANVVVPALFVSFALIFLLVYLGVRKSGVSVSDNTRVEGSLTRNLRTVGLVLGWLIVLVAFSMGGLGSANKSVVVPAMFLFFVVVFAAVFMHTRRHSHQEVSNPKTVVLSRRSFGVVLFIISILTPLQVIKSVTRNPVAPGALIGLGIVMMILGAVSVYVILRGYSRSAGLVPVGYILLILISLIPGLSVMHLGETSFSSYASAYFGVLVMAVLSWWGASLFRNSEAE